MDARLHDLSVDEKMQLVEELWDSIAADQASLPLTEAQRAELDRRLDEFEADGDLGHDATSVLDDVRQRLWPWPSCLAHVRSRMSRK